ncbi:hypothetical protein JBL43_11250 [Aureibaculum sp. A20]|uniref:DUF7822 domain-containing protein n=1 Tax=Aureibaculum flavum TaxID=2795986 RepID=A0ABS0WSB6_9FLAO|nr:hypothetical protein [Aureibaculum flavum]MBJ2174816.1 hypothetical protein [Aureibaculum flavum]
MANRSYLYSLNYNQGKLEKTTQKNICGVSESEYYIPLAYKILISEDVQMCNSIIWDNKQMIALTGNLEKGKSKLFDFLETLKTKRLFDESVLNKKIEEARNSLSGTQHYGLLEAGEIYDMEDDDIYDQNIRLYSNIKNIDVEITSFYKAVLEIEEKLTSQKNYLKNLKDNNDFVGRILVKLFSKKKVPVKDNIRKLENNIAYYQQEKWNLLGIDQWKDHLYYNF